MSPLCDGLRLGKAGRMDRITSEAESCSSVAEQRAKGRPIKAQSIAMARAMASICNDEQA